MGYAMLWGVEYEKKRKGNGGKRKKRWKGKTVCCPALAEQDLHPLCYEERLNHFRELSNFKIRGSAGQKAPL